MQNRSNGGIQPRACCGVGDSPTVGAFGGMDEQSGRQADNTGLDCLDGSAVLAAPERGRQPDEQLDQRPVELCELLGDVGRDVGAEQFVALDRQQQQRGLWVVEREDGRNFGGCDDGGNRRSRRRVRESVVHSRLLKREKSSRSTQPRATDQSTARAECVIDRPVGYTGGVGDCPDRDSARSGSGGKFFGSVEQGVEVVDAWPRHEAQ